MVLPYSLDGTTQGRSQTGSFFACAAFRDKKQCSFFQWADERRTHTNPDTERVKNCKLWPTLSHKKCRKRMKIIKKMDANDRVLCIDCGLLLLQGEQGQHEGQGHKLTSPISSEILRTPTKLFGPLENNKTFAQYLFSQKTIDFVLSALQDLDITHVLCVGCPSVRSKFISPREHPALYFHSWLHAGCSLGEIKFDLTLKETINILYVPADEQLRIHEAIQVQKKSMSDRRLSSLLLDLDHRYLQIYPPSLLCRYNMMNHYFFGEDTDRGTFQMFLREGGDKRVAMVIDPPFGIMVEALSATIGKIQDTWKEGAASDSEPLPVLWFFPYFMERRVMDNNAGYTMLDYKVDYDNHALFTSGEAGRKKGSPVRIFTNLPPKLLVLPADEGYWFCNACNRYSAAENRHCDICGSCTTKDGRTYRHCEKCARCVKPSRLHCDACNACDIQDHKCGQTRGKGCHICGDLDHKRRDCPSKGGASPDVEANTLSRERKRKKACNTRWARKKKRKQDQETNQQDI